MDKKLNDETMKELTGETDSEFSKRMNKNKLKNKFILDACCGTKGMWYNKNHPNAVYIDIRDEEKGFNPHEKNLEVKPDYIMDFRKMDFPDKSFKLVVFEPPHLSTLGKTSMFRKKFGCLNTGTWPVDIKHAFNECWRVLEDYGTLIFKWSNSEIPFKKILKLAPSKPLFYNTTNYKATSVTKWFCFMKIPKAIGGFTTATPEPNNDFKAHKDSPKPCPECKGEGKCYCEVAEQWTECEACNGQGFIKS